MSQIFIIERDCVLYEIWAEAEKTAENLKITTETGYVVCEVWAGIEKMVDNLNIRTVHDNWCTEQNRANCCKDTEKTCRDSNKVNAPQVLCPANLS
jgi:hypothetical protein